LIFKQRIGPDPHREGRKTSSASDCPDIWELGDGDFAMIGIDITDAAPCLPPSAGCGPDEKVIRMPRQTLLEAVPDLCRLAGA
jgi:hypothetical protein